MSASISIEPPDCPRDARHKKMSLVCIDGNG
jgi:hypothetical protein